MAEYHFVSTWRLQAPIEQVWEELFHAERWPSWWKYVDRVDNLDPGAADGVGRRQYLLFRTRLPYKLGFEVRVTRVQPPSTLEAEASGELEGRGRWTLTREDGGTLVRYNWDVQTTKRWMNLLGPVARPAFVWNHDQLMREGARGWLAGWAPHWSCRSRRRHPSGRGGQGGPLGWPWSRSSCWSAGGKPPDGNRERGAGYVLDASAANQWGGAPMDRSQPPAIEPSQSSWAGPTWHV